MTPRRRPSSAAITPAKPSPRSTTSRNPAYCSGDINCIPASRFNRDLEAVPAADPDGQHDVVNGVRISSIPRTPMPPSIQEHFGSTRTSAITTRSISATANSICSRHRLRTRLASAFVHVPGHNYIGHWTHEFSPTTFSDVYFGRNYGFTTTGTSWTGEDAAFFSAVAVRPGCLPTL